MKEILFVFVICIIAYCLIITKNESVTSAEFTEQTEILKSKIDSVMAELDSVKVELKEIHANTDSLKAGQRVIFNEVKKTEKQEFNLDKFFQ